MPELENDLLTDIIDLETGDDLKTLSDQGRIDKLPVEAVLFLYARGPRDVLYINYYEAFKKLIAWLGPFEIPPQEHYKQLPTYLNNWECNELGCILKIRPELVFHIFLEIYQTQEEPGTT